MSRFETTTIAATSKEPAATAYGANLLLGDRSVAVTAGMIFEVSRGEPALDPPLPA